MNTILTQVGCFILTYYISNSTAEPFCLIYHSYSSPFICSKIMLSSLLSLNQNSVLVSLAIVEIVHCQPCSFNLCLFCRCWKVFTCSPVVPKPSIGKPILDCGLFSGCPSRWNSKLVVLTVFLSKARINEPFNLWHWAVLSGVTDSDLSRILPRPLI